MRLARTLARGFADLLLPRACAVCHAPLAAERNAVSAPIICGTCWARCRPLATPQCQRCGQPRRPMPAGLAPLDGTAPGAPDPLAPCTWCAKLPPYVRAARSWCRLDTGTGSAIVHALKYGGWAPVGDAMGERLRRVDWPADVIAERTALVPVPLAKERERERGFNQSTRLAAAVSEAWHCPVWDDVVERTRATRTQTRLTPSERSANVSGAFRTCPGVSSRLAGAHLIIIDDVATTAATLNAVADALIGGGARIISYLTFGRAPDPGDRLPHISDLD